MCFRYLLSVTILLILLVVPSSPRAVGYGTRRKEASHGKQFQCFCNTNQCTNTIRDESRRGRCESDVGCAVALMSKQKTVNGTIEGKRRFFLLYQCIGDRLSSVCSDINPKSSDKAASLICCQGDFCNKNISDEAFRPAIANIIRRDNLRMLAATFSNKSTNLNLKEKGKF